MITPTQINNIPSELKQLRQWVCHKNKIPIIPGLDTAASSSDPSTWRTFQEAIQHAGNNDGIGFVFSADDPYVGIDIDHCIDENQLLSPDAKTIVNTLKSYTEKSQSGKGLHVICKGTLPSGARRNTNTGVEIYSDKRFFIVTGDKLSKTSAIADRPAEIIDMFERFVAKNNKQMHVKNTTNPSQYNVTFETIIGMLPKKKKEKFLSLWEGDLAEYNNDHSSADLALCSILAYYTKSVEKTDELFRQSELYRDKWDEIHFGDGRTYGQVTIERAFQNLQEETPWFDEKGRFKAPRLAQHLLETSPYIFHNQDFYHYENGVYRTISELTIKKKCREILGDEYNSRFANEVLHNMKISLSSNNDFSCDITQINLLNGLFDWQKSELLPHSSEYVSRIQLPVEYDENAACPNIEKFFRDVLPTDSINTIEELMGYCLIPTTCFEKAFMLVGAGRNGKSVFLNLLTRLIGKEHIANETLQDLAGNRFRKAELANKLVNIFADLSASAVEDSGYFKALVSSDDISVERKGKDPFKLKNTARMVFSTNEIPKSRDNSNAYFRRWVIVRFPNTISEDKVDPHLIDKLVQEMPGLLNMAIRGLKRLFRQGHFSESDTIKKELERYRRDNDTVRAFVDECCIADPSNKIGKSLIYSSYRSWCMNNGYRPVSTRRFNDRLVEFLSIHEDRNGGVRQWVGVRLLPQEYGLVEC